MHARPWTDLRALVLAFTGGVLLVHALAQLPDPRWLALAGVPALWPWRARWLCAAAAAGFVLTAWQGQDRLDERWPTDAHGEDHWVEGVVAGLPEGRRTGEGETLWRFEFEPVEDRFPPRIRVAWYHGREQVRGGECWRFELRLRTPHGSLNPGAFDYEGWLFSQGIGATATVRDARRCGDVAGYAVLRWRQWLVDRVRDALPPGPGRALVLALTVGDRSEFDDSDWEVFRATGTSHLVAISGLHVGIVAGAAFFLLRCLWSAWPRACLWLPAQRAALLGAALAAAAYALMAGFQPPVLRALLMLLVGLAALWAHRFTEPARALALAWLVIVALDPFVVMQAGLWLSFLAVAAIFYVLAGRLRPPGVAGGLVVLQLALGVVLAPLTLLFFQGAAWIAPLANLLGVPLFAVLAPWALGAVAVHAVSPTVGAPLLESAAGALGLFREALQWAATVPDAWLFASPPPAALGLALLGALYLLVPRGVPLRPLAMLCFIPVLAASPPPPRGGFELAVLDVGQGLAVVVRTAKHALLYDAGPAWPGGFDAGASVVAPYLLRMVGKLDLLFVSHGDNDHAGGVAAVRQRLRVDAEIGTKGVAACEDGMRWTWDGVDFEVLHPDRGGAYSDNSASCVLRVSGPFSVLLAGDIEAAAEARLVRDHRRALRADVLVAPHHGSKTSSSSAFVAAVAPRLVVFSAGWRHHFGHPRAEVVARYRAMGASTLTTGASGAIRVWRAGGSLLTAEQRGAHAHFWTAAAGP